MNLMTRHLEKGEKGLNQDQVGDELLNGIHTRFAATDEPTLLSSLCQIYAMIAFPSPLLLLLSLSTRSGTTNTLSHPFAFL